MVSVRKRSSMFFSALILSSFALAPVIVSSPAYAADQTFTVDCSAGALTEASAEGIFGADRVVTASVGQVIRIVNSSTTGTCVFTIGTARRALTGSNGTLLADGTNYKDRTVGSSGFLTLSGNGGADPSVNIFIDACGLEGSGTSNDPWLVSTQADFQNVGVTASPDSCDLGGHYLQTADLTGDEMLDSYTLDRVTGSFTGTYDGDHYSISIGGTATGGWADGFSSRQALFADVDGTIKKVRLTGTIYSSNSSVSSLVHSLSGIVSESSSNVEIRANGTAAYLGGLVWWADGNGARIQYSKYDGQLWWSHEDASTASNAHLGGLVAANNNGISLEIRDSYARPTFKWDNDVTANLADNAFGTGGLLARPNDAANVRLIRSYAAVSFDDTGTGVGSEPAHGGVVHDSLADSGSLVSVFYLNQVAIDGSVGTGTSLNVDVYTSGGLPEIVPLSSSQLASITSFQSEESSSVAGSPSGLADLSTAASSGSLAEQDYRWAIEQSNVSVFVPSDYTSESNFLTRQLFSDTSVAKSYQTRGTVSTVTGYPSLGRVWEICATDNDGYPVLVWEERTCSAPGGGSSSNDDTSRASRAASLGLTEDEYAAYLASGLTLEQFLAQRLAATGPPNAALSLGGLIAASLAGLGTVLLLSGRRGRLLSPR